MGDAGFAAGEVSDDRAAQPHGLVSSARVVETVNGEVWGTRSGEDFGRHCDLLEDTAVATEDDEEVVRDVPLLEDQRVGRVAAPRQAACDRQPCVVVYLAKHLRLAQELRDLLY